MNTAAQNSTFPMRKIPSMCRVAVYWLRTKTQWEWIEFFMFHEYSASGIRIALFSLPHTHAQRRLLREFVQAPCVYKNPKKAFHAIFYLPKLFIFANYNLNDVAPTHTTVTSPVKTSFSFFACSGKFFSSAVPCLATSRKTWWTWRTTLLALGGKRILYAQATALLYKRTMISVEYIASIDSRDYWIAMIYLLRGEAGALSGLTGRQFSICWANKAHSE